MGSTLRSAAITPRRKPVPDAVRPLREYAVAVKVTAGLFASEFSFVSVPAGCSLAAFGCPLPGSSGVCPLEEVAPSTGNSAKTRRSRTLDAILEVCPDRLEGSDGFAENTLNIWSLLTPAASAYDTTQHLCGYSYFPLAPDTNWTAPRK